MTSVDFEERAAIAEYDGGLSRADAEAQALQEIYAQRIAADPSGIMGKLVLAARLRTHSDIAPVLVALGLGDVRGPIWGAGHVVADVDTWRGDTWRMARDGEAAHAAVIVPATKDGAVTDLIACTIVKRCMRTRLGVACTLGADEISRAHETGTPLYVFADAIQWLRGHAHGAVILDWKHGATELEGIGELICGSAMAPRLYEATRRFLPRPTIAFIAEKMRHAA